MHTKIKYPQESPDYKILYFGKLILNLQTKRKYMPIMGNVIKIESVEQYNNMYGLETFHPLVSVTDSSKSTAAPKHVSLNYGIYAIYLKQTKCGDLRYGRQTYDYQEGTVTSFAPGQIVEVVPNSSVRPSALGLIFHPDLIRGTSLGKDIRHYSFFSYSSNEALHLSEEEKNIFRDCLSKIDAELHRPADRHSRNIICMNIKLLLDYCMRFYERQFETRSVVDKDILIRFEDLLDSYFTDEKPQKLGLPTVKYFAEGVNLSPNYFGDLVKKETGRTAQEYIQNKLVSVAKEWMLGSGKSISEIAYALGFQYPQHFTRIFKKATGYTPTVFRQAMP